MRIPSKIALILVLASYLPLSVIAQKQVKMKQADDLYGGTLKSGESYNRFVGDVIFQQNETTIYCDSAVVYKERNTVYAYGHVKITEGDSVTVTARRLVYNGNNKKARLRENVVFNKLNQLTLYTDSLDYDRFRNEAKYFSGGKLVDSTNVLTSQKGYYNVNTNMASFKKDVVATTPDYTLKSDTLQYNTSTDVVFFRAETELVDSDKNIFNYNEGFYDTRIKKSDLSIGKIETKSYVLTGNKLRLDDIRKYYTANGDVEMISKDEEIIITGDDSWYDKKKGIAKVFGHALMKKIMDQDTLFVTADTLVAVENDDPTKERVLAYNDVKMFKADLQGISDSLSYVASDSTIYFYNDPVLWTDGNQMSADSINAQIVNNAIDKLNMKINSFVISRDTIKNYNQIKGRDMVANFTKGEIDKINVDGNGESIFHALSDDETYVIGTNKIISSDIVINFKENVADNISFYTKPDASFIPPHEITGKNKELKGFNWRESEKPVKNKMLLREVTPPENTAKEKVETQDKLTTDEGDTIPLKKEIKDNLKLIQDSKENLPRRE